MIRRIFSLFIPIIFMCGLTAAFAQDNSTEKVFRSIQPQEALRLLQGRDDIIFLDVRTPKERSRGYIPGSQLVSFNDVVSGKVPLPKDKGILLVCAVGGRSYVAGQMLSKKGYKEIYNLTGGIKNWYKQGLPITFDKN